LKKPLKRQIEKKRMEYKQYNLKELQKMLDKEPSPEELNKIMVAIIEK